MEPTLEIAEITRLNTSHPGEEALELYALGRLPEAGLESLETHLLVCADCQESLLKADQYVAALKAALSEPQLEVAPGRWTALLSQIEDFVRFPRPVPIFSLAAVFLVLVLSQSYNPAVPVREAEVVLRSMRGGADAAVAKGPAKARLSLRIQSEHLPVDSTFRVRIVDLAGKPVWAGSPERDQAGFPAAHVNVPLRVGAYWVRLYDAQQALVQEYGLRLE